MYYRVRHTGYQAMVEAAAFEANPWCDLAPAVQQLAAEEPPSPSASYLKE